MKNQPKIFRPNKLKALIGFLGCSIFVGLSCFLLEDEPLKGWLVISFFGLGAFVILISLLTNTSYLKLNEEGFEVKGLFRRSFTKWSDIKGLRQGSLQGNKMIYFDYTAKHKKWKAGNKVAKFLSGKEGSLISGYDIKTEELLNLMIDYKQKSK